MVRTKDAIETLQHELSTAKNNIDRLKRAYERKCVQLKETQAEYEKKSREAAEANNERINLQRMYEKETAKLRVAIVEGEDIIAVSASAALRAEQNVAEVYSHLSSIELSRDELFSEKAGLEAGLRSLQRDFDSLKQQHNEQTKALANHLKTEKQDCADAQRKNLELESMLQQERCANEKTLRETTQEWSTRLHNCAAGWSRKCKALESDADTSLKEVISKFSDQYTAAEAHWVHQLELVNHEWAERFDALGHKWTKQYEAAKTAWANEKNNLHNQCEALLNESQFAQARAGTDIEHWHSMAMALKKQLADTLTECAQREQRLQRQHADAMTANTSRLELEWSFKLESLEERAKEEYVMLKTKLEKSIADLEKKSDREQLKRKSRREGLLQCIADLQAAAKADMRRREELERALRDREAQLQYMTRGTVSSLHCAPKRTGCCCCHCN